MYRNLISLLQYSTICERFSLSFFKEIKRARSDLVSALMLSAATVLLLQHGLALFNFLPPKLTVHVQFRYPD
jgi:hypothetical protein